MNWLINLIIYQATWFVGVLYGDGWAWLPLVLLLIHFRLAPQSLRRPDALLVVSLLGIGIVIDGTLQFIGFFTFSIDRFPIPFWLMSLWMVLATLPNHSLSWLKNRYFLSALFGALGGPLAYWAGVRLGAASFNWPLLPSLLVLGAIWGVLWPAVMLLSTYYSKGRVPTDR